MSHECAHASFLQSSASELSFDSQNPYRMAIGGQCYQSPTRRVVSIPTGEFDAMGIQRQNESTFVATRGASEGM